MGYELELFAFNKKPNCTSLRKIKWLKDWRLYEEKNSNAWYLIGQFENDLVVFNSPKITPITISSEITDIITAISSVIQRGKYMPNKGMITALSCTRALSAVLHQPVLCLQSNDDGNDGGCIYDDGKLEYIQFEYDWDRAFSVDDKANISIEKFYPVNTEPDAAEGRLLHQIACEIATTFFATKDIWAVPDESEGVNGRQLTLIARVGEQPTPTFRKVLHQKFGENPSFSDVYDEVAPHIALALCPTVILADRAIRKRHENMIWECFGYIHPFASKYYDAKKNGGSFKSLDKLLSNILHYQNRLHPKPEFRNTSYNFIHMNKKLRHQLFLLSIRRNILGLF